MSLGFKAGNDLSASKNTREYSIAAITITHMSNGKGAS